LAYEPTKAIQYDRFVTIPHCKHEKQTTYQAHPVLLNNYFGRQFNSLNDVVIHPKNKDIYFTDTIYGYVQDFRPAPGLQDQVYRFNPDTGAVTIAADGFDHPNGMYAKQPSQVMQTNLSIRVGFLA
jgi:gluconolactonase